MMGRTEESLECIVYRDATWRSWANQDRCMIGRHKDFELFKRTDLYIWHGIRSSTEKKLAKHIREWQDKGYAFTYKIFPNMGHGTLAGGTPGVVFQGSAGGAPLQFEEDRGNKVDNDLVHIGGK